MHNMMTLYDELNKTFIQVEQQIDILKKDADQCYNVLENRAVNWQELRDENGAYLAPPLLLAKAECLRGMAELRVARDKK